MQKVLDWKPTKPCQGFNQALIGGRLVPVGNAVRHCLFSMVNYLDITRRLSIDGGRLAVPLCYALWKSKRRLTINPLYSASVGMTRLELATTGPPDQHSKPTELHPVLFKAVQNYTLSVRLANFWTSFSLMPSLFCNFVL